MCSQTEKLRNELLTPQKLGTLKCLAECTAHENKMTDQSNGSNKLPWNLGLLGLDRQI